eukprot:SAG31_NODE_34413_length_333_cov_0.833333_1_plen_20_part_10
MIMIEVSGGVNLSHLGSTRL